MRFNVIKSDAVPHMNSCTISFEKHYDVMGVSLENVSINYSVAQHKTLRLETLMREMERLVYG